MVTKAEFIEIVLKPLLQQLALDYTFTIKFRKDGRVEMMISPPEKIVADKQSGGK